MANFGNVKEEYKILKNEIDEVVQEISTATEENTDCSKLILFQTRLRDLNRKLDYQSDNARRVRENYGSASDYSPQVKNIKEDRLLIARSMNDIATNIELELKKRETICLLEVERSIDRPILKFPEFNGEDLSYLKFKTEFLTVMGFVSLSDEIKAIYLKQSLKDRAEYCVSIHESYDEMWKSLDQSYNNKWKLTIDSLDDFFSVQKPKDGTNEIENYWDTAINKLRYILSLEMSTEHILLHYIIDSLPMPFRSTFINRIPCEKLKTQMISINEASKIFNRLIFIFQSSVMESNNHDSCAQVSDNQNDSDEEKGEFPFPEFHGDMSTYKFFKGNFMSIGNIYGMSDQLKLHHLKLSLKDDALRYIGSWGLHHDSYEDMWKYLDRRYNDFWLTANKEVKNFFNIKQPINEHSKIDAYWLKAISGLRGMLYLELNLESIFCIHIMQCLPMEFQVQLVKKLQCKEQGKKVYGIEEAGDAFNEVMALKKITHDTTTHNENRNNHGYKGSRKFGGRYRGSGRGRACKRYD